MGLSRNPGQKKGNNTLFFIAGALTIVLIGMVFWGMSKSSSIDQLIQSAAPDSSAYASDSLLIAGNEIAEEPEPEEEKPQAPEVIGPDTTPEITISSGDSATAKPIENETVSPAIIPTVSSEGDQVIYGYKIRKGDTMYKLAARFGNKPSDIMSLNGLTDMSVQADKTIKVKVKALHAVSPGEGLNAIAEKYGVPAKSIRIANDLNDENIPKGSKLLIPLK
jgi:LysM repeat protein